MMLRQRNQLDNILFEMLVFTTTTATANCYSAMNEQFECIFVFENFRFAATTAMMQRNELNNFKFERCLFTTTTATANYCSAVNKQCLGLFKRNTNQRFGIIISIFGNNENVY